MCLNTVNGVSENLVAAIVVNDEKWKDFFKDVKIAKIGTLFNHLFSRWWEALTEKLDKKKVWIPKDPGKAISEVMTNEAICMTEYQE